MLGPHNDLLEIHQLHTYTFSDILQTKLIDQSWNYSTDLSTIKVISLWLSQYNFFYLMIISAKQMYHNDQIYL